MNCLAMADNIQEQYPVPQHFSTGTSLLRNSSHAKLISQQQLSLSSVEDLTHMINIPQRPRRNNNTQAGAVITKIEDIFESLIDCITNEKKCLVLRLKSRGKPGRRALDSATGAIINTENMEAKEITFPGKTQKEAWKFGR